MVAMIHTLARWLALYAAERWPEQSRAELRSEWTSELRALAEDPGVPALRRGWRMLAFGGSLAFGRPAAGPAAAPLAWRRLTVIALVISGYLLAMESSQRISAPPEGYRALAERLFIGALALIPVLLAAAAGMLIGRHPRGPRSPRPIGPVALGVTLLALVAASVGLGTLAERYYSALPLELPVIPPTMKYGLGHEPPALAVSWLSWLVAFIVLARLVLALCAHRGRASRVLGGLLATVVSAGIAVTLATFVQFDRGTTPLSQSWLWFAQWLVPSDPFTDPMDGGMTLHWARDFWGIFGSYPHVLLACSAFGIAFLLAQSRSVGSQNAISPAAGRVGVGS